MKKIIYIAVSIILVAIIYSCSRNSIKLNFVKDNDKDLETILIEAKAQKKMIFMDVYTTWCGPCKWMDENVFIDKNLADKFNKKFINYKVDGESFEGVNIGIRYRVDSYPTYIFIDQNGNALHRIEGSMPANMLIEEANFAMNLAKK